MDSGLAAHLSAAIEGLDSAQCGDWTWQLAQWGKEVQVLSLLVLATDIGDAWPPDTSGRPWLESSFRPDAVEAALAIATDWLKEPTDEIADRLQPTVVELDNLSEMLMFSLEEESGCPESLAEFETAIDWLSLAVNAARAACWTRSKAGAREFLDDREREAELAHLAARETWSGLSAHAFASKSTIEDTIRLSASRLTETLSSK